MFDHHAITIFVDKPTAIVRNVSLGFDPIERAWWLHHGQTTVKWSHKVCYQVICQIAGYMYDTCHTNFSKKLCTDLILDTTHLLLELGSHASLHNATDEINPIVY